MSQFVFRQGECGEVDMAKAQQYFHQTEEVAPLGPPLIGAFSLALLSLVASICSLALSLI